MKRNRYCEGAHDDERPVRPSDRLDRHNHFARGSGCYTCTNCGTRTRDTGGDSASLRLCQRCHDRMAAENAKADR